MMSNILKKITPLPIIWILLGCVHNPEIANSEQQKMAALLKTSFEKIYLAKGGLAYPQTKEILDACVQSKDQPCLDAYNSVEEARNSIETIADLDALNTTLNIIEQTCLADNDTMMNFTCFGGIMSLFFFNSPGQDDIILARVKNYPMKIQNMIFNNEFYWYHNRPNPKRWVQYIEEVEVDWQFDTQKQYVSNMFELRMEEIKGPIKPWVEK